MKKDDVMLGGEYAVKVSDKVVPVVITDEHPAGGWVGTNQQTGKQVRIKSAQRLRGWWDDYLKGGDDEGHTAPQGEQKPTGEPEAKEPKKRAPRAKGGAPSATTGAGQSKTSGLDAAAKVLQEAGEPLTCKTIVERAFEKGYWRSEGKTPAATVYSAILREIQKKGEESRFHKVERGKFTLAK
jgi:hypothetical protein